MKRIRPGSWQQMLIANPPSPVHFMETCSSTHDGESSAVTIGDLVDRMGRLSRRSMRSSLSFSGIEGAVNWDDRYAKPPLRDAEAWYLEDEYLNEAKGSEHEEDSDLETGYLMESGEYNESDAWPSVWGVEDGYPGEDNGPEAWPLVWEVEDGVHW